MRMAYMDVRPSGAVVGRNFVPEAVARTLGNYPQLGKDAARDIPGSKLVELRRVGHTHTLRYQTYFTRRLWIFLSTSSLD